MFRYVITTYMLLLSLTGPSPCCCTIARLVALTTSWMRTAQNDGFQLPPCCQKRLVGSSDANKTKQRKCCGLPGSPTSNKAPNTRCTCEKSHAIASPKTVVSIATYRPWLDVFALSPDTPLLLAARDYFPRVAGSSSPPPAARSGRQIRAALQLWQC